MNPVHNMQETASPLFRPLKLDYGILFAMVLVGADATIRLAALTFWWLDLEIIQNVPVFRKGVQHPALQVLQFAMDSTLLLVVSIRSLRTPRFYSALVVVCLTAGVTTLVLGGIFYSLNVVGVGFVFAIAAGAFRNLVSKLAA